MDVDGGIKFERNQEPVFVELDESSETMKKFIYKNKPGINPNELPESINDTINQNHMEAQNRKANFTQPVFLETEADGLPPNHFIILNYEGKNQIIPIHDNGKDGKGKSFVLETMNANNAHEITLPYDLENLEGNASFYMVEAAPTSSTPHTSIEPEPSASSAPSDLMLSSDISEDDPSDGISRLWSKNYRNVHANLRVLLMFANRYYMKPPRPPAGHGSQEFEQFAEFEEASNPELPQKMSHMRVKNAFFSEIKALIKNPFPRSF